jgi:hypothetical protein
MQLTQSGGSHLSGRGTENDCLRIQQVFRTLAKPLISGRLLGAQNVDFLFLLGVYLVFIRAYLAVRSSRATGKLE